MPCFFNWALVDIEVRIILPLKIGSKCYKNNTEDEVGTEKANSCKKKGNQNKNAIEIKKAIIGSSYMDNIAFHYGIFRH